MLCGIRGRSLARSNYPPSLPRPPIESLLPGCRFVTGDVKKGETWRWRGRFEVDSRWQWGMGCVGQRVTVWHFLLISYEEFTIHSRNYFSCRFEFRKC